MADIQENLFQAIDIITAKRLTELAFDKTIKATITNDSKASKGEYELSDGATTFTAYSNNFTYKKNNEVYVSVPNGDLSLQKIIVGKVISEDSEYYTYTPPLDDYVDITGNLVNIEESQWSLLANNTELLEKTIWKAEIQNGKDYGQLGLRANFKSWLKPFNANQGNYGLRLDVTTTTTHSDNEGEDNKNYLYYSFYLDSDDMYGNPYNFESYFKQEKLFDLSKVEGQITYLRLVFYQRCNFKNKSSDMIYHEGLIDNLFISEPYVSLGYNINDYNEDAVLLYTLDSETYNNTLAANKNRKTLQIRWIHKDEEGNIYSIDTSKEIPDNAQIHWYYYELKNPESIDSLAGAFWTEIDNSVNQLSIIVDPDTTEQSQKYKVIIECPSLGSLEFEASQDDYLEKLRVSKENIYSNVSSTEQDKQFADEAYSDYYQSILNKHTVYRSDILEFISAVPTYDKGTIDLINSLSIICDTDGYKGVYLLYNLSNQIQNSVEATKMRILEATYTSLVTGEQDLDTAESIIWKIPIGGNTMICSPELDKEYDLTDGVTSYWTDGNFAYIKRMTDNANSGKQSINVGDALKLSATQKFRIKDYYMESATNNIVYCYVVKNNIGYEAAYEMTFGPMGTNGTDYTFRMAFDSDIPGVSGDSLNPIKVNLALYDFNNEEVPKFYEKGIEISWYSHDTDADIVRFCDANGTLIAGDRMTITQPFFYIKYGGEGIPYYCILNAKVNAAVTSAAGEADLGTVLLRTQLPVPYRVNHLYTGIEGTTRVVYNSRGTNPQYYKQAYQLYTNYTLGSQDAYAWTIAAPDQVYYPILKNGSASIIVPSIYVEGLSKNISAVCKQEQTVVWTQPILMYMESFSSALLNSWSGDLTIDEKNGIILSTMIGAGKKENDNSFSGVLMGDVKDTIDDIMKLGLYGFNYGQQSFGWKIDGTGFIGKSGQGQILFDGNHGKISSGVWLNSGGKKGMEIDLDGPTGINEQSTGSTFKMYGNAGKFEVNTSENSITLVKISGYDSSNNEKKLFVISTRSTTDGNGVGSKYYLQSLDFDASSKVGTRLDIQNGRITSYGSGGSFLLSSIGDAILNIKSSDYNTLMYVGGQKTYYLQSNDWNGSSQGTKLNLANGMYQSFGSGGKVEIRSSSSTMFKLTDSSGVVLMNVGESSYYLQSHDFATNTSGIKINLNNGHIQGYKFSLKAGTGSNIIAIDSTNGTYPITVAGNKFTVGWDGTVTCENLIAKTSGKIGPFHINSASLYTLSPTFGGDGIYLGVSGLSVSDGNFTVDSYGKLGCRNSAIFTGSVNIGGSVNISGNCNVTGSIKSVDGNGVPYYNFTDHGGTIGGWTISGNKLTADRTELCGDGRCRFEYKNAGYIRMGYGTKHPEISGINLGEGGIALGDTTIADGMMTGPWFVNSNFTCKYNIQAESYAVFGLDFKIGYHVFSAVQAGKTHSYIFVNASGNFQRLTFTYGILTGVEDI